MKPLSSYIGIGVIAALGLLLMFVSMGCASLANLVTAEGLYANKTYILETHTTNIGVGFEQPAEGNLPLPKIGYWKTDVVITAAPLDDDDAMQYSNERDVKITTGVGAENPSEIVSGNRTRLDIDAQKYLKSEEE